MAVLVDRAVPGQAGDQAQCTVLAAFAEQQAFFSTETLGTHVERTDLMLP